MLCQMRVFPTLTGGARMEGRQSGARRMERHRDGTPSPLREASYDALAMAHLPRLARKNVIVRERHDVGDEDMAHRLVDRGALGFELPMQLLGNAEGERDGVFGFHGIGILGGCASSATAVASDKIPAKAERTTYGRTCPRRGRRRAFPTFRQLMRGKCPCGELQPNLNLDLNLDHNLRGITIKIKN